ncbi:MAG: hypothetical protein GY773_17125 [Actinomycetia bacterium]|nr:hypothetical protein [Actinomycetes bacterium]
MILHRFRSPLTASLYRNAGRTVHGPDDDGYYQVGFIGRPTHIGAEIEKVEARARKVQRHELVRRVGDGNGRVYEDDEELIG